jgi:pSer/pThr/pTyr-binding forkhead associated (FHA) protein
MVSAMPELIFVSGPQQGERAVIMTGTVVLGRSPSADVKLIEEAISREHVRFQLTRDGWVMENLSANGTLVNGKRYKKDKKVLLDTGDVMGVGLETRILYVAPGDDPEEALADWRQANPPAQAKPAETKAHAGKPRPEAAQASAAAASAHAGEQPKAPVPTGKAKSAGKAAGQPAQPLEEDGMGGPAQKGSKNLKLILLSVVLLGLVGFGAALLLKIEQPPDGPQVVSRLTAEHITAALDAPIDRPPSPTKAAEALDLAVRSYSNKDLWSRPGELYRCVKQFKLYRAYSQSITYPLVQYERAALAASRELDAMVREKYETAWKYEKARSYRSAKQSFEQLMRELPAGDVERDSPIDQVILKDIKQHIKYLNSQLGKPR